MEALDTEIGIGYPINKSTGISPLLENFYIPGLINQGVYQSNVFLSILLEKTIEAIKINKSEIIFVDDDVKNFEANWEDLPPTIFSMFNVFNAEFNNTLIYLTGFYGTCGAKLFARFG